MQLARLMPKMLDIFGNNASKFRMRYDTDLGMSHVLSSYTHDECTEMMWDEEFGRFDECDCG